MASLQPGSGGNSQRDTGTDLIIRKLKSTHILVTETKNAQNASANAYRKLSISYAR